MTLQDHIAGILGREAIEVGFSALHLPSGEAVEINAAAPFPTASVCKVPIMAEVYRQAREGRFALGDRLRLEEEKKTLTTGVLLTLEPGLQPTIRDLCTLMTIVSDNTATTMLLELVGAERVTASMAALGLTSIRVTMTVHEMFLHAFGLPLDRPVGVPELAEAAQRRPMDYASLTFARTPDNTVASAGDMTRLMALLARRELVDAAASEEMIAILRRQQYSDRVPRYLPWRSVANKTGSMRGLRNDSGIIERGPEDLIAFTLFTFDPTPLPPANSPLLVERNQRVSALMAEVGQALWDRHGR